MATSMNNCGLAPQRKIRLVLLVTAGLLLAPPLLAQPATDQPVEQAGQAMDLKPFTDAKQQQLFQQLTADLRCPKCQNQNIADSNAVVAVDMRNKTYELVRDGQSYQEVVSYMKDRYGDFVHYQPPLRWSTIWLWLLPVIAIFALTITAVRRSRQSQQSAASGVTSAEQAQPDLDIELEAMIVAAEQGQPIATKEQK